MKRAPHAFSAIAALVLATPAAAQDVVPTPAVAGLVKSGNPTAMTIAFKAICIDHAGDPEAQAAAATTALWNFTHDGKGKGPKGDYSLVLASLNISTVGDKLACALTSAVEGDGATFGGMSATAQKLLSLGEPERPSADTAKWAGSPNLIYLKVAQGKPFMIAVYGLFTPKARK